MILETGLFIVFIKEYQKPLYMNNQLGMPKILQLTFLFLCPKNSFCWLKNPEIRKSEQVSY
jgi:hypothetical protein